MPRYKVRIEYAMAFDLDIEVEARDRVAAVEVSNEAANDAGLWSAIRDQFAAYAPEYAGGEMEITDVRVLQSLRSLRTGAA